MKQIFFVFISFFVITCKSQTEKRFNLDFETHNSLQKFSKDWLEWGEYEFEIDTVETYSGKFSAKITSNNTKSFGCVAYRIPANYDGKFIQLEGYMKIKNVKNGNSGLVLRIDGRKKTLEYDSMQEQNIQGTKDWQKYSITLPYPEDAKTIYIGGFLDGTGEAWFDNFGVSIDGKDIESLKEKEKITFNVVLDKEFDESSKINIPKLNEELLIDLELLGKTWGFLKYYHPEVGKGVYNWDYELFRLLPKYMETKSKIERNQLLLKWIEKYGKIDKCNGCKVTSENAFLKPDMFWLNDFELNIELKSKLINIYQNRFQGKHYYISVDNAGNPEFLNENRYYSMPSDDDGFKLLGLYRYWNMINYFFPYKHLTDKDWGQILKEYIPKIINSKNRLEYELSFIELIGEVNDSHATTYVNFNNVNRIRGEYHPPFRVQFIENKLVVTGYYNPELKNVSGVEVGDIITHIDGESIKDILDSVTPYYPASNEAAKLRDISMDILRSNKKEINIDYYSNNKKNEHLLPLYKENDLNKKWYKWTGEKSYKLLSGNIGYVTLETIQEEDIPKIKEAFKDTKGIIIDIRNYPSTFVPFSLGSYFVTSTTPFVKFTNFNKDNPGEFNFTDTLKIENEEETYKGKLVVLVNEISQSQSEYTAMAFRSGNNTTIVGSTTAGADGNVSTIHLPGGLMTRISGIGIYYPDGTETQRVGIIPDIEIKPTIKGIKEGRDEVLEKAVQLIDGY